MQQSPPEEEEEAKAAVGVMEMKSSRPSVG
jgi:hypothetical protein